MTSRSTAPSPRSAIRFLLLGRVQGIGVRPAIARLAGSLGLSGRVSNGSFGVSIHVEGDEKALAEFSSRMATSLPGTASLQRVDREDAIAEGCDDFRIEMSSPSGRLATEVPSDLGVCDDCLNEIRSREDRRFLYPFTSCTRCGPRYSIIKRMPYERGDTVMREFTLCAKCRKEYSCDTDRRFHSQTNACADCGPSIRAVYPDGRRSVGGAEAITQATTLLQNGMVVAVKGIGGYQLLCDATCADAVTLLRRRKRRPDKPLAVMIDDRAGQILEEPDRSLFFDAVNSIVLLSPHNSARLVSGPLSIRRSPSNTIGFSEACCDAYSLATDQLAAGLDTIGVLRATTPLHEILLNSVGRPLVVTSANFEGDPLISTDDNSRDWCELADLVLEHDRRIEHPVDDSVVRIIAGRPVTIRSARGLAPLPLPLPLPPSQLQSLPPSLPLPRVDSMAPRSPAWKYTDNHLASQRYTPAILAVGGHQKAAIALSNGSQSVLGPHIGDLDGLLTRERYVDHINQLLDLYAVHPAALVCDIHPDYFSSEWAIRESRARGIPLFRVQHHHAHIVAGMLEQEWLDRTVLGVAFDGTGYGDNGTIWGGEFLRATTSRYERIASFRPFPLPGGERAIREPWRVAAALLAQSCTEEIAEEILNPLVSESRLKPVIQIARRSAGPWCSSVGRLFDGVASIIFRDAGSHDEGALAMRLEAVCDMNVTDSYELTLDTSAECPQFDWRPFIQQLVSDVRRHEPVGMMAMKFHRALAASIATVARLWPELPVVLGGGCFQNRMLTELVVVELEGALNPVGLPGMIPPNDGGLAAGQLAIGMALFSQQEN